jgi:lipid A 3-O-deacylase
MHARRFVLIILGLAAALPGPARADDGWDGPVVTLTEENDSGFSDRHYTQGLNLRYLSTDYSQTNWLSGNMPSFGYDTAAWKWGIEAGQQMFTPERIAVRHLIESDRPYGGWLYSGFIYQSRGATARATPVMETYRLQLGVVGPESLADEAQVLWHYMWGFQRPNGWRNQLKTEMGVQLNYDRRYRFACGDVWSVQLLPEAGFRLGNIRTDAHLGTGFRAGYNIPNEFAWNKTGSGADLGVYVVGAVEGRAVLLDVFLDGNNFRESHEVNKRPLVAEGRIGIALSSRHVEVSVMHAQRTAEFNAQGSSDAFTSLTLTLKF